MQNSSRQASPLQRFQWLVNEYPTFRLDVQRTTLGTRRPAVLEAGFSPRKADVGLLVNRRTQCKNDDINKQELHEQMLSYEILSFCFKSTFTRKLLCLSSGLTKPNHTVSRHEWVLKVDLWHKKREWGVPLVVRRSVILVMHAATNVDSLLAKIATLASQ